MINDFLCVVVVVGEGTRITVIFWFIKKSFSNISKPVKHFFHSGRMYKVTLST